MLYLIDAYNWLLSTSSEEFIDDDFLQQWIAKNTARLSLRQFKAALIFDAGKRQQPMRRIHLGDVEVIFTAFEQTADELILEMICSGSSDSYHVITSDRQLSTNARALGAKSSAIKAFLRKLSADPPISKKKIGLVSEIDFPVQDARSNRSEQSILAENAHYQRIFEKRYRQSMHKLDTLGE